MEVIYKWSFENTDELVIPSSHPINFLTAQFQGEELCVWGIVNKSPELKKEYKYLVSTYGTGWFKNEIAGKYLGTVQEGYYVWHIFVEDISNSKD